MENRLPHFNRWPVFILPGWQDSDSNHWQSHWQHTYGWQRVVQGDWIHPQLEDWTLRLIQTVRAQTMPPILVSHSLGGTTIAHALKREPELPVRGAFIVAPPDLDRNDVPPEIHNFRPTPLSPLPFPSWLIASSNDPMSDLKASESLAFHWGSQLKCVGNRQHIGGAANLGNWEEGQLLFAEFLNHLT